MVNYVATAFSLSMLPSAGAIVVTKSVSESDVKATLSRGDFTSAVGHEATANIISRRLGIVIPFNRISIKLKSGDTLYVFQLLKRLEEGQVLSEQEVNTLPAQWYRVEVR